MLNVEIKARTSNPAKLEKILRDAGAEFVGLDHQRDIYYKVDEGRLKLRKGNIENSLIFYQREDKKGAKSSHFELASIPSETGLENVLAKALSIKVIVEKKRKIFYLGNLKLHIDHLQELGDFVEIEARDLDGKYSEQALLVQCKDCMKLLEIESVDLITNSYSDMLLALKS